MNKLRLLLVGVLLAALVAAFWLDAGRLLDLHYVQARFAALAALVEAHPFISAAVFFCTYAGLAALSIPGAALICTLAGGALFGLLWGSVLVSFASAVGATLGFLLARFMLRDFVEGAFPFAVEKVNAGIAADGAYYLFGLRLVAVFPYFIVNLVMGLTRLPVRSFYWVSQLGMLPGTIIFVNAGTRLVEIDSARDILAPDVAGALALLGIFPLLAKKLSGAVMRWHRKHP